MSLYIPCVRLYCNIIATVVPYDRYPDAVVKLVPFSYMDVPSVFPCTKVFPFAEAVIGKMEYSAVGTLCRDVMEIFVFRDLSAHAVREFYPFPDVRFLILLHPPVFRAQAFAFEEMRIVQDIGFLILTTQKKTTIPSRNRTVLPAVWLPQNSDIRIQRIKRFINMLITSSSPSGDIKTRPPSGLLP